jgi:site-specific recombinase XerD
MSWPEFLEQNYTPKTAAAYAFEVRHYLAWVGGDEAALTADYSKLIGYLATLRKRYDKPATLQRIMCSVKAYYRYLLESGQRTDHPAINLRLRDGARPQVQTQDLLSKEELALLLRPRPERYPLLTLRNAVIIGLLVYQALAVRELSLLEVGHVDLPSATVRVPTTTQTLGRTLQLAAPQVMKLYAYLTEDRPQLLKAATNRLILTSRGTAERGEGVHYLVETLRPLLPGKRLTPTTIRQSVIAGRLKSGQGLRQVQAFVGHKKISATERYRENNLEALRLAVEKFHPLSATH